MKNMKKRPRGALHKKQRASSNPRSARPSHEDFASLRAAAMDSVLTSAEQAVRERTHRHD